MKITVFIIVLVLKIQIHNKIQLIQISAVFLI